MASHREGRPETKGCHTEIHRPPCRQAASNSARNTSVARSGDAIGSRLPKSLSETYCVQSSSDMSEGSSTSSWLPLVMR